ncbi:MAG: DegT/DnrJ/EryC1/StrS family aminotransferase, partial [Ignavibacteria bacterium]|nr:DegT/DnrJ/EryC1/StrS family aminotransferase [Ignavibacteria bacterium]
MIPYDNLSKVNEPFQQSFESSFSKFLQKGWFILGDEVKKFQEDFAAYHSMNNCIGVANGLDALILSLVALKLPKNSEVIVPSNTYIASIISIIHAG